MKAIPALPSSLPSWVTFWYLFTLARNLIPDSPWPADPTTKLTEWLFSWALKYAFEGFKWDNWIFYNLITAIRGHLSILSPIVQFRIFSPLANKFLCFFCCGFDYLDSVYWTILIITGSRSLRVVIAFRDLTGLKIISNSMLCFWEFD